MEYISIIKAEIESMSPLFISDGEELLLIEETKEAYIPASTLAGAFRNYLEFLGEDSDLLFGKGGENSIESSIYISDSFAAYGGLERRDGIKIHRERGSSKSGWKTQDLYLKKGLIFSLNLKIKDWEDDIEIKKNLLLKALRGLDDSYIRLGGYKSNGLGIFKVKKIEIVDFDFKDISQWIKYLNKDYEQAKDITDKLASGDGEEKFVEFNLNGSLTTPILIGFSKGSDSEDMYEMSISSDGKYIIPGKSFKGSLRSRMEKIGDYFNNRFLVKEIFGDIEENSNLSRIFVRESIIENHSGDEREYGRIRIDKFTGGTKNIGIKNDIPILGDVEFKLIYKLLGEEKIDSYAIGIIALALRDLAMENLNLGSGYSIGRGRYRAEKMTIKLGNEDIGIDFGKKTIRNENRLNEYIKAVKNFTYEGGEDGKQI